jgi:chromosome segregation ATPase
MWAELKPSASASASWSAASTSTTTTTTTTTSSHTAAAYEAKYTALVTSVKLMTETYNSKVTTYKTLLVEIAAAKAKYTHFQSEYDAQYKLVTRLTERLSTARTELRTVVRSRSSYETRFANLTEKVNNLKKNLNLIEANAQ